jgi:hypothetical protein
MLLENEMKKKLEKRISSLESLSAKMHAKYGAQDDLVLELDREIVALRESHAQFKTPKMEPLASRGRHASRPQN